MAYNEFGEYVPDYSVPVGDMRQQLLAKNQTPQFIKNLEALYQVLPQNLITRNVKPLTETTAFVGSGLAAPFAGVVKGVGQNILQGTNRRVDRPELAEPFTYQPRTEGGQELSESIIRGLEASKLPPYIANMGRVRFTPDDLRVAGKTAVSDVRNFPMDYANARAGFQREYPTLGSTVAGGVNTAQTANRALNKAILSPADLAVQKITGNPLATSTGVVNELAQFNPLAMAIKPKGGNWPTSLARPDLPLFEQGRIGEYLDESTVGPDKPLIVWNQKINELGYTPEWVDYLKLNNASNIPVTDPRYPVLAKKFTELINSHIAANGPNAVGGPPMQFIKPVEEIQASLDAYNKWILEGPHKKYITTQFGTGIETDPVLRAVDEANVDPFSNLRDRDANLYRERAKAEVQGNIEAYERALLNFNRFPDRPEMFPDPETTLFYPDAEQFKNVGEVTARTPAGRKLENAQDFVLADYSSMFHPKYSSDAIKRDFPVSTRLKKDTPVYDILSSGTFDSTGLQDIKKHLLDKLVSGEISPEKLPSVSVESVVKDMIKAQQDRLRRAEKDKGLYLDWRSQNHQQLPADVAFTDADGNPTGAKMVVFNADMAEANPDLVIRNLSQDTKELNHCVGSCGHGTPDYPNRHVPMVEPHTGTTPKGSDASYGPNYIRKIKDGQIQIASLRGPNGESKATLELVPENTRANDDARNDATVTWLRQNAPDYLQEYVNNKVNEATSLAIKMAADMYPDLQDVLNKIEKLPNKFKISQIKGEGNGKVKPEDIELVKNWLNSKGDAIKDNRISDLDNLPGVMDLRNTRTHEIADVYQTIHPDKLDDFFHELIDKKLEGNELTRERYNAGYIDPFEIMSDEIPRFVTADDLKKAAERNGFDIERRPEDKKTTGEMTNGLNGQDRLILEMEMTNFFDNGRLPNDFADFIPDYQRDVLALIGNQNPESRLPRNVHTEVADLLINQQRNNSRGTIQLMRNQIRDNGRLLGAPNLTAPQLENILNIITNWLEIHPFED